MSVEAFVVELNNKPEYQRVFQPPQSIGLKAGRVHLEVGAECGTHSTEEKEEVLVILQGQGQALLGEKEERVLEIGVGKIAYIPPHTIHNITNTGTEPLVYIFTVTMS
jgi:mannose-6-phosphate isomerase-like protein (cupin superfamily)